MTAISVVIPTRSADRHLDRVLHSLNQQTLSRHLYEVLVVDDGAPPDAVARLDEWHDGVGRRAVHQRRCGLTAARNLGLFMAASPVVLLLGDDEAAAPDLLEEHISAHATFAAANAAIVGRSSFSPDLPSAPLLHFLRRIERLPLGYPDEPEEATPDFTHFRSRQLSVKRAFLARHAVFDDGFAPLDDVELGFRLRRWDLDLRHWPAANSSRATCPSFLQWSERSVEEGRAIARLGAAHPSDAMQGYCRIGAALEHWRRNRGERAALRARIEQAEGEVGPDVASADPALTRRLWLAYRACFDLDRARGIAEVRGGRSLPGSRGGRR